jgi:hypothetical protein
MCGTIIVSGFGFRLWESFEGEWEDFGAPNDERPRVSKKRPRRALLSNKLEFGT